MLPDRAERVSVTRTVFVVNRPHPSSYLRFPVYRFARTLASTGSSDTQAAWERRPGEVTALYVPEILLINTTTEEVSLRYKDTEIEAPCAVPMENISSLPSMPADVVHFSKQLEALLRSETTQLGTHSSFFTVGGDTNVMEVNPATMAGAGERGGYLADTSTTVGSGGERHRSSGDYVFIVVDYTTAAAARQEGYLMKEAHFERFLKTLTTLLERDKTADVGAASGVAGADNRDNTPAAAAAFESIGVPLSKGDLLSAMDSTPSKARPGSSANAACNTVAHNGELPCNLYKHGDHHAASGSETGSVYPEVRLADGGGDADMTTTSNSKEPSSYLMLPRIDPTNSDGDSDADLVVRGCHVDASSSAGVAAAAASKGYTSALTAASSPVLFGLCAVVSKRDSAARRGGVTKSVAVLGPSLTWLEPFFPVLVAAAQCCCAVNGTDESALRELQRILKRCYYSVNNAAAVVAAGRSKLDQLTAEISEYCTLNSGQQAYVYYSDAPLGDSIKVKLPLLPESSDMVFKRYSLESLIEALGPSLLQLLLGILTEKKILILSRKGEAADVCEAALSLGIIGNMLDRNFTAQRVFPYVSVSSADHFMQVPGYIVGTLNPIFDNVSSWGWDLLCDLDNKSVITAAERLQRKTTTLSSSASSNWSAATAGLANAVGVSGGNDTEALRNFPPPLQQLYKQLTSTIYHLRALRIGAVERNHRLQLIVEDFLYTVVLVGYVAGGSVSVPSALYPTFAHRSLASLRSDMMLTSMMDNVRSHILYCSENPALLLHCVALRHCTLGETPVQQILEALLSLLSTAYDVKLFLRRMPLAVGGLSAVGMQLTSPSAEVRAAAAALLTRVESVPEGKAAVASMNNFFVMLYENSVTGKSQ
ncbi:hypothetical protein LPMP_302660 [Leishmania panamensis]|uniref:Arf3-interacting protein 1 N-terminal domain-containing protein n=1 Tax=Leishmania panamensis TaxID=5679 RepID=A0A088RWT4_LEIPA|nr:hypothetical protein LPMP_302660 [Leishmania panamensis]AIO00489.1 hypothetical protein LPMP_302660 [Leishmania panamensis]